MAKKKAKKKGKKRGYKSACTKAFIKKCDAYLKNYKTKESHPFPSLVGLCKVTGQARSNFYFWQKDENNHEIRRIMETIDTFQELDLLNYGITGEFNSAITSLVLGKHGYHKKQDIDHKGGFNVTMSPEDANTC